MRLFLIAIFLCCISLFAAAQSDSVSVNFIQALNDLRSNPRSFEPFIDEYYYEWRSFVSNRKEFDKAIREIKQRLKTQPKLPTLAPDSNLLKAALDHAND